MITERRKLQGHGREGIKRRAGRGDRKKEREKEEGGKENQIMKYLSGETNLTKSDCFLMKGENSP